MSKRIKNKMAEKSDLDLVKDKLIELMDRSKSNKRYSQRIYNAISSNKIDIPSEPVKVNRRQSYQHTTDFAVNDDIKN